MSAAADPAANAEAVTPDDTTTFDPPARGLYVGGDGDVVVDTLGGQTDVTFVGVTAGTVLPVTCIRVKAATGATDILRLW